jgi:Ca2+-transporting ATPase
LEEARTVAFCSVIVFEWLVAFNVRSDEITVFRLGIFRNLWLSRALVLAFTLQLMVVYLPPLQIIFQTVPLSIKEWAIAIIPGVSIFSLETLRKIIAPKLFSLGKWQPLKNIQ